MSAFSSIIKTIFVPLLVAGILYAVVTHALLPLHRRYIRRYQHYLPLHAASSSYQPNSSFSPAALSARAAQLLSSLSARLTHPFAPSSHIYTSPPSYRQSRRRAGTRRQAGHTNNALLDSSPSSSDEYDDERDADSIASDEGEGMVGFAPVQSAARREALERIRREHWDEDAANGHSRNNSDSNTTGIPRMGLGRMGTGLGLGSIGGVHVVDDREVERGERRLSRELEEGFRDSSESDEAEGRGGNRIIGTVR